MKKNFTFSALFILAIILSASFIKTVSAQQTAIKDLIFSNTANKIIDLNAPQVTGVVINEIYGGGGNAGATL